MLKKSLELLVCALLFSIGTAYAGGSIAMPSNESSSPADSISKPVPVPGKYILEETPGKKKLNIQELDVSPGTTLSELLDLFPELLAREGDSRLERYDLQVNGISTGGSGENMLSLILAQDIDKIEVSESPSMSQQVNGQGAVINVVLKALPDGVSGNLALQVKSLGRIKPSATINYKTDKLSVRGSVLFDYNDPYFKETTVESFDLLKSSIEELDLSKLENLRVRKDTIDRISGYELARVQLDYNPDSNHSLKTWVWEKYSKEQSLYNTYVTTPLISEEEGRLTTNRFSLSAGGEYKRTYAKSVLTTKLSYSYNPGDDSYYQKSFPGIMDMNINYENKDHSVSGFTKWTYKFISGPAPDKLELTPGVNYEYSHSNSNYQENIFDDENLGLISSSGKFYLSPYVEAAYNFSKFQFNGGIRYQYYNISANVADGGPYNQGTSDANAFFKFGWQIHPHHYLNMVLERTNQRPSARQIYPIKVYDPYIHEYVLGNKDLRPRGMHNASLNYITDFTKAGHTFVASTALQYIKVTNIICTTYNSEYQSYINDGKNDILSANAMIYYRYGAFSLNLDGNVFQNWSRIKGKDDIYFNYNVSVVPRLSLRRDWRITPKFVYYSHILTNMSYLGDYFYTQFNVSKTWGRWTVYAEFQDIFHSRVKDWMLEGDIIHSKEYDLRNPHLVLGFVFKI